MSAFEFAEVARLPAPGDNVGIATRRLEAGTRVDTAEGEITLSHTLMEGHRFAVAPIPRGRELLSWGLPFGAATRDIAPGDYVCNAGMLEALGGRRLDFELPAAANFEDRITPYVLDEATFEAAEPLPPNPDPPTFLGFDRGPRGAGTRNYVVVMGTSSRTAAYARLLARRLADTPVTDGFDGVVAVAHTEGGGAGTPNNRDLLLRTLAGFAVHPNVGALLAVDYGSEAVPNRLLEEYLRSNRLPIDEVPHRFLSLEGGFDPSLDEGERLARGWAESLSRQRRVELPASRLRLALQCGGSDAFSGVSGNPLAAWAARELIRAGGAANLAETDELIGAEPYVLHRVRDSATAHRFLEMVRRFKERVAWHGESAEANPSGGNKYRGLYNIVLKSIGAAMKRHPEVPLEGCLEYSEAIPAGGFYFMDSPGNDLESIAGQVASGCNLIYFVTGNGSITNFPFVPTVKIVTTTPRFELLEEDMDVNAGAYQDGAPMDALGQALFDLTLEISSGRRSRGEQAGHSQVSIWRDWPQRDAGRLAELQSAPAPTGQPLAVRSTAEPDASFEALDTGDGLALDRVGLVLPTSLCSGQVARMAAERLNAAGLGSPAGISRFAALVHTEGCGVSGGSSEEIYRRTLLGYLTHPSVALALLLEHGCEKTHNDYMRAALDEAGIDDSRYGFASVQLDGGIERVLERVEEWFAERLDGFGTPPSTEAGLADLRLGLLSAGPIPDEAARAFAQLTGWIAGAGGTVVVPEGGLAGSPAYAAALGLPGPPAPTIAHGQRPGRPGLHVMEAPIEHWTESLSGLGATGVEILLAHAGEHPVQGHPLVPLLQVSAAGEVISRFREDLDGALEEGDAPWAEGLLQRVLEVAARQRHPRLWERGVTDFQITRGLLGVSM